MSSISERSTGSFEHVDFNPNVHTLDALAEELDGLSRRHPTLRVAGSIGRMGLYCGLGLSPLFEYDQRQQSVVSKLQGKRIVARDIDVLGVEPAISSESVNFPIDTTAYCGRRGNLILENNAWWLVADRFGFAEELNGALMDPYPVEINGHTFNTLQIPMHYAVMSILGDFRSKKVAFARSLVEDALTRNDRQLITADTLPFERLGQLNRDDRGMRVRGYYRRKVPEQIRTKLRILSSTVSTLID